MLEELNRIHDALRNELPVVAFRKPDSAEVEVYFQKNDTLYTATDWSQKGFVFAPFLKEETTVFIPKEESTTFIFQGEKGTTNAGEKAINPTLTNHLEMVAKAVECIKTSNLEKVVLSQVLKKPLETDPVELFKRLLLHYPSAFVYLWYHPKVGMWLGATPETLMQMKGTTFQTMSLAGTKSKETNTHPKWSAKEYEEQSIVTAHMESVLQALADLEIGETKTVSAGRLWHLQTEIRGRLKSGVRPSEIVALLHPTPAVCGTPVKKALDFINEYEPHQRSFYTGFLGIVEAQDELELFVNLRCVQLVDKEAHIYVGGGITKDSVPEEEWKELLHKAQTMVSVL